MFFTVLFAYFVNLAVDVTNRQSAINQNRNKYRKLQESNVPSGKALMIEIAKMYQDLPDPKTPGRAEGQYRYWAQNLGLSYFEYYRGRFYTPKEAEGLPHINCYQYPNPRTKHSMVSLSGHVGFKDAGNTTMTPYLIMFGGSDGTALDDVWVFISGLINGTKYIDVETETNRKYTYMGSNLAGDTLAQSCEERETTCNRCNRWHKVAAVPESRGETDCFQFTGLLERSILRETAEKFNTQWCPLQLDKYMKRSSLVDMKRFDHAATVAYSNVADMKYGAMMVYGGQTKNGLSNTVWYLDKMPLTDLPLSDPTYTAAMGTKWKCLKTYGANEYYPPKPVCNASTSLSMPQGNLSSGKLLPQTECEWIIEPTVTRENYAIVMDILRLDISSPPYTCESYMEVRDFSGPYTSGSPGGSTPGTLLFHGCARQQIALGRIVGTKGKLLVKLVYEDVCPAHSGFDAVYHVRFQNDSQMVCHNCSNRGKCLGGVCQCHEGYHGDYCQDACGDREKCVASSGAEKIDHYPPARSGHTMVSSYAESYTKVVHPTYSRTIQAPVLASIKDRRAALNDISTIYDQESRPSFPWVPYTSIKRTLNLDREIQSFQCTSLKSPAPDAASGREQNQFPCKEAGDPTGRTDAIKVGPDTDGKYKCLSTWLFPDKFKLKFDCEGLKAELDKDPQIKWGDSWLNSQMCTETTDWIPQNSHKKDLEDEFNRTFGQSITVTVNKGYSATQLRGGGSEKIENVEWHDSVNFGGGCTGRGETLCGPKTDCTETDGDNSRSSVFCQANPGTDEYAQQCVCEDEPMKMEPEVCSKMGSNVVTIQFDFVPECHDAGNNLPFCNLPDLFMAKRESDLKISFTSTIQAESDCTYEARFCGCSCKLDGVAPYYVILKGNASREVFTLDLTQTSKSDTMSQIEEMNTSRLVQESFYHNPIRISRTEISFFQVANGTATTVDVNAFFDINKRQNLLLDINNEKLQANKTTIQITADYYESTSHTKGEGAKIIVFGGWTGAVGLNDLWVLNLLEQVGNEAINRSCKAKLQVDVGDANSYELYEQYDPDDVTNMFYDVQTGDIQYFPCSNLNESKHSFFPNFHKINRWTRIGSNITGDPPPARYQHSAVRFGSHTATDPNSPERYRMVVFGGIGTAEGPPLNDLWELRVPVKGETNNVFKWSKVSTTSEKPKRRWYHAAASLKRDSGNVMVVYGGWNGQVVMRDVWFISLDEPYGTVLDWTHLNTTRGVWHSNRFAGFFPFDSTAGTPGFTHTDVLEESFPPRYGHTMSSVTSSFDGKGGTRDVLVAFSGTQSDTMSNGINTDIYGLWSGGKDLALYYICPDIDMACSHPTYKAISARAKGVIHPVCLFGVFVVFTYQF